MRRSVDARLAGIIKGSGHIMLHMMLEYCELSPVISDSGVACQTSGIVWQIILWCIPAISQSLDQVALLHILISSVSTTDTPSEIFCISAVVIFLST